MGGFFHANEMVCAEKSLAFKSSGNFCVSQKDGLAKNASDSSRSDLAAPELRAGGHLRYSMGMSRCRWEKKGV